MVLVPDMEEARARMELRHKRFTELTKGKSVRFKKRMERVEKTFEVGADIPHVRVLPADKRFSEPGHEDVTLRECLIHPATGVGFRDKGSIEWPLDQFTLRRLRDGDVVLDESHPHQQMRPHPQHPARPPVARGPRPPIAPPIPPRSGEKDS